MCAQRLVARTAGRAPSLLQARQSALLHPPAQHLWLPTLSQCIRVLFFSHLRQPKRLQRDPVRSGSLGDGAASQAAASVSRVLLALASHSLLSPLPRAVAALLPSRRCPRAAALNAGLQHRRAAVAQLLPASPRSACAVALAHRRDRTMKFFHPMFTRNGMRNLKDIKRGTQTKKHEQAEQVPAKLKVAGASGQRGPPQTESARSVTHEQAVPAAHTSPPLASKRREASRAQLKAPTPMKTWYMRTWHRPSSHAMSCCGARTHPTLTRLRRHASYPISRRLSLSAS